MKLADIRFLHRLLGVDEPWAYTLVTSIILADAYLGRGMPLDAARALDTGREAKQKLERFLRKQRPGYVPNEFVMFEERCRATLEGFEPPMSPGRDPVRAIRNVCRRMQPKRASPRPAAAIDALDAVITAGRFAGRTDLEARVLEQLARMLHSRVLFHHVRGIYLQREHQRIHTLSSWTMLKLARSSGLRTHRIRPRPEFWRPEQKRPRGVLVLPLGKGTAALARPHPFSARERQAVRTILRFLDDQAPSAAARQTPQPAARAATPRDRHGLVGDSPAWNRILEDVWTIGPATCSVVIRGETGTGKELVARALHMNSTRAQGPFVAVNCAAIHGETMLSELFGHIRGAFTGADRSREGLLREANGGSLFLDEVGDMPPAMQVALLRALQEGEVRPVGSARSVAVDVRVIAATNLDLEARMEEGRFREDLFHRLAVMELALPPLRERLEDLPALAQNILTRRGLARRTLPAEALAALARHDWPGNVRELDNVLQAAALLSEGPSIHADIVGQILKDRARRATPTSSASRLQPRASQILSMLHKRACSAPTLARALRVSTRTVNRDLRVLVSRGLVAEQGAGRARHYTLVD